MATFAYSGRTRQGQTVSGERMAESMDGAVTILAEAALAKAPGS